MNRRLYTLVATLLVATISCSGAADSGEEGTSCAEDPDCRGDLVCRNSTCSTVDETPDCGDDEVAHEGDCVPTCGDDTECADDEKCAELGDQVSGCLPEDDVVIETDDREVGESCTGPGQCVEGASCIGTDSGTYECMAHCEGPWSICEDGSVCTPVATGEPICYTGGSLEHGGQCNSNLACGSGLLCVGLPDRPHHCLEACHTETGGCGEHRLCRQFGDAGKGYCRHHVGRECVGGADCAGGLTCTMALGETLVRDFPDGYCTSTGCETDADCPGESVCRPHAASGTRLCLAPCRVDADCRVGRQSGYRCLTESFCETVADPDRCRALRDGDNLCAPPALFSPSGG
jgi:hypothetical protein